MTSNIIIHSADKNLFYSETCYYIFTKRKIAYYKKTQ